MNRHSQTPFIADLQRLQQTKDQRGRIVLAIVGVVLILAMYLLAAVLDARAATDHFRSRSQYPDVEQSDRMLAALLAQSYARGRDDVLQARAGTPEADAVLQTCELLRNQ
jgi:nucleotide-binding universal stress UspA family protein